MSKEKKISDDELVEIAGGGVIIDVEGTGVGLEPVQDVIGSPWDPNEPEDGSGDTSKLPRNPEGD